MSDLAFQDLSTVQSDKQPNPPTIASAATISPKTFMSTISGTTPVTTIVPPVTGAHMLAFRWTTGTANGFNTGGNIAIAYTTITNRPILLFYDPVTALYYPMAIS
jgi:hypothetical protein